MSKNVVHIYGILCLLWYNMYGYEFQRHDGNYKKSHNEYIDEYYLSPEIA